MLHETLFIYYCENLFLLRSAEIGSHQIFDVVKLWLDVAYCVFACSTDRPSASNPAPRIMFLAIL